MNVKKLLSVLLAGALLFLQMLPAFAAESDEPSFELIYGEPVDNTYNVILIAKNCLGFTSGDFDIIFDDSKIDFVAYIFNGYAELMPDVEQFNYTGNRFEASTNVNYSSDTVMTGMYFRDSLDPEAWDVDVDIENVQFLRFRFEFVDEVVFPFKLTLKGEANFESGNTLEVNETFSISDKEPGEENSDNDYEYKIENETATITKYIGDKDTVAIPDTLEGYPVTIIGEYAFSSCREIVSITIPDSIISIEEYAFYDCINLQSVTIGDSVTSIGNSAFYNCSSLQSVTIGDSVTSIGVNAFSNCSSLQSVTIPDSVTSIGGYAFSRCSSLQSVTIPDAVTRIEEYAFYECSSLQSITIPDDVTVIGNYAFCSCSNLQSAYIPDAVTSIGEYAFYNCKSLESLVIPETVTSIGDCAFSGCSKISEINVNKNNPAFKSEDGVLFSKNGDTLMAYPAEKTQQEYTIPSTVETVSDSAFKDNKHIEIINIPSSVKTIESNAFAYCASLSQIEIPVTVEEIGGDIFLCCDNLNSLRFLSICCPIPIGKSTLGVKKGATIYGYKNSSIESYIDKTKLYNFVSLGEYNGEIFTLESGKISDNISYTLDCTGTLTFSGTGQLTINEEVLEDVGAKVLYIIIKDGITSVNASCPFFGNLQSITFAKTVTKIDNITLYYYLKKATFLNPKTKIPDSEFMLNASIIYGYNNSTAQEYAKKYSCEFVAIVDECEHKYNTVVTSPTCTKQGYTTYTCTCGDSYTADYIKANGHKYTNACDKSCNVCKATRTIKHTYTKVTTKATLTKNGKIENKCTVCGYVASKKTTIYSPKTIKLSKTEYTYNGKVQTPSVTVKDSKGNTLKKDTDYTVKYESGRKTPGKYTVTITFKGKYSGTKKLTYTIAPRVTSKVTATSTTTTITLKWNKVTGAEGYRIYKYNSKTKTYEKYKDVTGTSLKISKLKAGTKYKFKVRAFTKDDGTIMGAYSPIFETATKAKTPTLKVTSTKKGTAALSWSNVTGESGYQVYYATSKNGEFKKLNSYKVNVVKGSKSKLTSGKTYYFKVRAYTKTDSGTVYSTWSTVKSVRVK